MDYLLVVQAFRLCRRKLKFRATELITLKPEKPLSGQFLYKVAVKR